MSDFLKSLIPENNRLDIAFARPNGASEPVANLIHDLYLSGFVGACNDQEDMPAWARRVARYTRDEFFADTPGRLKLFADVAPGLSDGSGECHMPFRHALEMWVAGGRQGPEPYTSCQDYGSCVDCSCAEGETGLVGFRAADPKYNEEFRHAAAWYKYANRGYCSDGWTGSGIATVARRIGTAFRIKYQIEGNAVDFTNDDENERIVARTWCRSGVPNWLREHTVANHSYEDGAITAFNDGGLPEIRKAIKAGGFIHHSGTRTSGGSRPFTIGSTGPHMQTMHGYDDSDRFRQFCRDVLNVTPRDNDFPVVNHQTWGPGWRGECADQYWPDWWGQKPQGAWVWWASDMVRRISLDYVWLPWVKGFPRATPLPVSQPAIGGSVVADQLPSGVIAIRGELELTIPDNQLPGTYKYIIVPDGAGRYKTAPKPVL